MVQLLILDGFEAKYSPSIAPLDTLPSPPHHPSPSIVTLKALKYLGDIYHTNRNSGKSNEGTTHGG